MADYGTREKGILTDSGTNEVEIMIFTLRDQEYGVNVAKVQQVVQFEAERRAAMPLVHPALMGTYVFRDQTIPLIDLGHAMGLAPMDPAIEKPLVMACEFNRIVTGFFIDSVDRIRRLSWTDMEPLHPSLADASSCVTGSVRLDGHEVLLVDLEKVVAEIAPDRLGHQVAEDTPTVASEALGELKVLIAEDSAFIRNTMRLSMTKAGMKYLELHADGMHAFQALAAYHAEAQSSGKPIEEFVGCLITDIEMPQMDGLTLCRRVKQELGLTIPVVVYSSLISEQMAAKCRQVGADAWLAKPQVEVLIEKLEEVTGRTLVTPSDG